MECGICRQAITAQDKDIVLIEHKDGWTASLYHSNCYEAYQAKAQAEQAKRLQAQQQLERAEIAKWNALSAKP